MTSFRNKYAFLIISLILVVWLSVAQLISNSFLILSCLFVFLAFIVWAAANNIAIPVLLFFLPWTPLLKIEPGAVSFYTIGILAVLMVYLFIKHGSISSPHIVISAFLILFTLIAKISNGYTVNNVYILFFAFLMFFPLLSKEIEGSYDFYLLTIFFVVGVVTAALSSMRLMGYPTISRFMQVHSYETVTRMAGYYGDPNFYSAHISAALSGVLIMILHEKKTAKRVVLLTSAVFLIYCGLLSVSKSFFVILFAIILLWLAEAMFMRGKISFKLVLIFTVIVCGVYIFSSTVFTDLIDMVLERFEYNSSVSAITTGRTDLWSIYIKSILSDPWLLLFGKGYTSVLIGDRISHNTLIQLVYQFGLIGSSFIIMWEFFFIKRMLADIHLNYGNLMKVLILAIASFGPWLALDLFFFDEFFLIQFFVFFGMRYLSQVNSSEENPGELITR